MRILVISDTHGYIGAARRVIAEQGPWDQVIHLGDSVLDAVDLAVELGIDIATVRGNNEFPGSADTGDELVFEAGGARFYAIHGHELDLNPYVEEDQIEAGLAKLAELAEAADAKAALFGHTHQPVIKERNGVLLINPGGMGLGDRQRTYAVVTVEDSGSIKAAIEKAE